jgi:exodeoxyribonuclease V gamma subunit
MKRENRMIEIFLALLDIPSSRFTAGDVLRILDEESVRNAFDIAERDLDLIERWIGDTKIRWGRDGNHRKLFGLPPFEDNSWVAGMKRMILGYAMPVGEEHLFHDILPYDNLESGQAELFGRFVEYIREIFDWADAADQTLTVKQWTDTLFRIVDRFFTAGDESENDVKTIRDTLHSLVEASDLAGCEDTVTFDVIRFHLKKIFDHSGQGQGFIKGGVTFCSMLPMRSIPFSIVCLLGMNANGYPRQTRATGFDLIASHPKPGDRSRRNDDRYLFLESLISARQCFYISYIGRSIRDNSTIEPSVLVSELLDYIKESYDMPEKDIHAALVFEHPLQPFSEQYFIPGKDSIKQRHVSYSSDNYLAAVNGLKPPETNQRFFNTDIDSDNKDRDTTRISLREFCDFFRHPGRYILERVLGISFQTMTQVFENEEPFQIHGLDRYTLENRIVSGILNDGRDELLYPRIRAKGILPLGRKGENAFREIQEESEFIAQRISLITEGRRPSIRDIDYTVGGLAISGQIEGIFGDTLVQYRPAGIKGKDWMEVWITHLVLNAATGGEKTFQSFLGGFERKSSGREWMIYQIDVPENPAYHLENLVSLYFNGIRNVLHFFPETSLVFYETRNVSKAKEKWEGNTFAGPGEGQDPYNRICFRGVDPFETPFADIAIATFEPLFRNVRSI